MSDIVREEVQKMLVAVSVVSAHIEETHRRWRLETFLRENGKPLAEIDPRFPSRRHDETPPRYWEKEGYRLLGDEPRNLGPAIENASRFGGLMYVLDLESGSTVWMSEWGDLIATPSGFCFDGSSMVVCDLEGSNLFEVDMQREPGCIVRRFSNPVLNDMHSVAPTRRGFLVSSTGMDMVVELDREGRSLYEWWAGDHGFTEVEDGTHRMPERGVEQRGRYYHTRHHTTHLNAARYRDDAERFLLVLLWRQGRLVEIDTQGSGTPRTVLDGLSRPHAIRSLPDGGFMVANSQGEELVVLNRTLEVERRIPSVDGWIQDALPLPDGTWLIADVNRFRLITQDDAGTVLREYPFNRDWRVFALETVPAKLANRLCGASRAGVIHHNR
jgi:hypothetical protein